MSNQKIVVINLGAALDFSHKEFTTVKEMSEWIKGIDDVIDPEKDLKIIVGEERCLLTHKGRASNQYNLTAAGCGCQKG